jgi:hypothetical protein
MKDDLSDFRDISIGAGWALLGSLVVWLAVAGIFYLSLKFFW